MDNLNEKNAEADRKSLFIIVCILFGLLITVAIGELIKVNELNQKYDVLVKTCPCYNGSGGQYSIGNFSDPVDDEIPLWAKGPYKIVGG